MNHKDRLKEMYTLQKEYQDKFKLKRPLGDWVAAMGCEVGELWQVSNAKWWKHTCHTKEDQVKELVDVVHFVLGYMLEAGITPDELFSEYLEKLAINYKRQASGY